MGVPEQWGHNQMEEGYQRQFKSQFIKFKMYFKNVLKNSDEITFYNYTKFCVILYPFK